MLTQCAVSLLLICYIKPWEEWMNKIQYVPFQPVSCLNSNAGANVNKCLSFWIHICTSGCACATMSCCGSDLFGCRGNILSEAGLQSRRKAQRRGLCVGECRHHMHSNSSMRCLVFPDRICLRVLYLSRPARMFSAWIMSFTVFLLSSRALANSELKAWKYSHHSLNASHTSLLLGATCKKYDQVFALEHYAPTTFLLIILTWVISFLSTFITVMDLLKGSACVPYFYCIKMSYLHDDTEAVNQQTKSYIVLFKIQLPIS